MAKRLQHRGGTTSQHSSFTGAVREVTVDTDKNTLVVHDGATAGGHPLATATNFTSTGIDDNATSTAITIDSSERVGIGTNSPTTSLHVNSGTVNASAVFESTDANSIVWLKDSGGATALDQESGSLKFSTGYDTSFSGGTERMRIDSSGNLLVGKTSTGISNAGFSVLGGANAGTLEVRRDIATANSSSVGYISRGTSDGNILTFYKDTSSVGSIGTAGGSIYIGNSTAKGVFFTNGATVPGTSGVGTDNTFDLGTSGSRWKDLYLGGGLYVGGTGTANLLDDYEEGTFTPQFSSSGASFTYTAAKGVYTKIGRQVCINIYMQLDGAQTLTANTVTITGLPFTSANIYQLISSLACEIRLVNLSAGATSLFGRIDANSTSIVFYESGDNYANTALKSNQLSGSSGQVILSGTYPAS